MKTLNQKLILLMFLGLFFVIPGVSQENDEHASEDIHHAKEPGWEAVLSGIVIYDTEHEESLPAAELHLTYWITHQWAFGAGYTMVFEHEGRIGHEIAALASFKRWNFLTLNAGPSFSLPNSHKDTEVSAYLEAEFAFKLGEFHAGPTLGNLIGETYKIFGGLHISYEF